MSVLDRIGGWLARISQRGDLIVAILMLIAVTMILIPLPTFLVDILITSNIAISVLILLSAIYVTHPLQFSSLPAVILISTVFRLAITITTARLILLQADAGDIVSAFGSFIVGGNIIVGLITFLIITIAQFVVVAKGAERVAEVAARFTLDALPGKQMSIDAELRNGDITQQEARHMREHLERESQLYGAMDGAMKFVKGDIIANIIVIFVNLIGGISIGTLQRDMSLGEAASTYSLLTVGDGLVAQIPALLVGVAAGTMVTRVATSDGDGDLGRQVTQQLLRDSRALTLASAIMIGLSFVPGFPMPVFLVLGAAFGAGAFVLRRREMQAAVDGGGDPRVVHLKVDREQPAPEPEKAIEDASQSYQIMVRYGSEIGAQIPRDEFETVSERMCREIENDLGINIPALAFDTTPLAAGRRLRVDLDGAPILEIEIPLRHVLVEGDPRNLELLDVPFEEAAIGARRNAYWVADEHVASLEEAGIPYLRPAEVFADSLARALHLYAGQFIGIQETSRLLGTMQSDYADLLRQAQDAVPLQKIAEILRRLVEENIPIRNMRIILEALVERGEREQDAAVLTEHVRAALKRQISYRAANADNIVSAYVMMRSAEDALRGALRKSPSGAVLDFSDVRSQAIVARIENALAGTSLATAPVVVTAPDVRRHLRDLLVHNGLSLSVLSYQELAPEFNIQPIATIASEAPPRAQIDTQSRQDDEQTTST